ncbi:MAG: DUF1269 domain-containing protein [Dehalococcoidia bacterium]
MSTLVAIVYPDEGTAAKVMDDLGGMEKSYLVNLQSAVYATKDPDGKVQVHGVQHLTGVEAAWGAFWGLLFGILFFVPIFGILVGAGMGALFGHFTKIGLDDKFVHGLSDKMTPNSSAVFLLVKDMTTDRVVSELSKFGGEVLQTSLPEDTEKKLQEALAASKAAAS